MPSLTTHNTPALRFPGYTGVWEQQQLKTVTNIVNRTDENSSAPIMMITASNGFIDQSERYAYDNTGASLKKYIILHKGELAYNHGASKLRPYGSCFALDVDNARVPFVYHCFSTSSCDPYFLSTILNSRVVEHQLRRLISSGARMDGLLNISYSDYSNIYITLPTLDEQKKITQLLRTLDGLIHLHQRQTEQLKKLKTGLLHEMFPREGESVPRLRFPGFTTHWKQQQLGNIATFINGRAYSQDELLEHGRYPVLRVGNFYTNDSWYYSDLELADKYYAHDGDLLYTWSATFGPHIWHGDTVIYHYHIWKIDLSHALNKLFALYLLEYDKNNLLENHNGSTMVHITKAGIENEIVLIPSDIQEQEKIGSLFHKLDDLINLHEQYVTTLIHLKKGLLQKMFPQD